MPCIEDILLGRNEGKVVPVLDVILNCAFVVYNLLSNQVG
jgi:hypothetical protein